MAAIVAVIVGANIFLIHTNQGGRKSRPYRVEAARIAEQMQTDEFVTPSDFAAHYECITGVVRLTEDNRELFYDTNSDYLIKEINGELYRFDYESSADPSPARLAVNVCFGIAALGVILLLWYLREKIIKPFDRLRDVPYELAKGNLSLPLKESRDKYFGRFLWGLDLLREHLEQQKADALQLQKEKKTLLLSLSHDIKTPLGVIELYAKALEKGLYRDERKKAEVAVGISAKCGEIKRYIDEIIEASHEDFLDLQVENGEFYLSEIIRQIDEFYTDKMELLQMDFTVGKYTDCILQGDGDRAVEVVQNLIENAIKYGDGKGISVTFRTEEDCLLLSVTNGGCTLSEAELPHIFDSFWRGSNVGSVDGSGLGLYICRQLMRRMNGEVFAETDSGQITVTAVFRKA